MTLLVATVSYKTVLAAAILVVKISLGLLMGLFLLLCFHD